MKAINRAAAVPDPAGKRSGLAARCVILVLAAAGFACDDHGTEVVVLQKPGSVFAINDDRIVTLGWTGWSDGVPDEIEIHRSLTNGFAPSEGTHLATIPGNASRYEDSELNNGVLYYYRLVPVEVEPNGGRFSGNSSFQAIGRPLDYSAIGTLNYDEHIQPIFNSSCAVHGCHGGGEDESAALFRTAHGEQFSLKSWDDLMYGEKDASIVIPYKSARSELVRHVNDDTLVAPVNLPHMPLLGFSLPAEQVTTLISWIDDGAKNSAGEVPFPVSSSGRILSVCASEDLIAVTDIATNFVIRYVNVGRSADPALPFGSPHHVKVDPTGSFFYVTLINSQQLWKFSAATYEHFGSVPIPFQPADLVLTATGDTAYVTSFNSSTGLVSLVDTRTMQVIRSVTTTFASNPHGIVMDPDQSRAFITNAGSGNLTVLSVGDNSTSLISLDTLGNPFGSDVSPYLADITPDGRYLFVTDYAQGGENVYVIDLDLDPTKPSRVIPIGGRSVHVAVTPDGTSAFVCNLTLNTVHIIGIPDFSVRTITDVGKQPHGVVFTPDGRTAYVTTENTLSPDPPHHPTSSDEGVSFLYVIDVPSARIIRTIEVGAFSQGLAFAP